MTDRLRNEQLADSAPILQSFCIRPLLMENGVKTQELDRKTGKHISLLPLSIITVENSHHPFGWNDGAMIPNKGAAFLVSTGIYAHWAKFSLQLQPEIVYAQNLPFETFPTEYPGPIWAFYYQYLNKIDQPEQFGIDSYKKFFPGQSSLLYHTHNLALGISTENIWWGPGIENALVMSNNAPGFLHATIHTTKPITSSIGSFEFEIIGGKLNNSGIAPPDTNKVNNGIPLYQPKNNNDWRYMNGLVVSWQPKWVKGLFLGFSSAAYLYHQDLHGVADWLPLQNFIHSSNEKDMKKGVLGSVFIRYVLPEENAELYAEYGRNDKAANIINLISDKDYPRGYVVGMRKLANLRPNKSRMEFTAELTQLELPTANLINRAESWYTHDYVRQGYTNYGQVMGAGIGPGSNSQMLDISWLKGDTKLGVELQRIVRNNDLYYNTFAYSQDWTRHWTDLTAKIHGYWKFNRFYINASMGLTRTLNYQYWALPNAPYLQHGYDFLNFHGSLAVVYRW